MSLMQLLTVGRSFAGTRDGPSGYKYQKNALPKFAPGKSSSPAKTRPEEARAMETPLLFDEDALEGKTGPGAGAAEVQKKNETLVMSVLVETPEKGAASAPAEIAPPAGLADSTPPGAGVAGVPALEASPFAAGGPKAARRARRSFFDWLRRRRPRNGRLVQAEWSLERITVVRNDLSDSDLELVPRPLVIPRKAPRRPGLGRRVWNLLTLRPWRRG